MEVNHDIHNRSRNRKQDRRPRWNQGGPAPNPPRSNRTATGVTPPETDAAREARLAASLRELCVARRLVESSSGTRRRRRVLDDLDAMLCAWSESLLPGSSSYADIVVASGPGPGGADRTAGPSLISFGSYRLGVHTPDADVDCLVLAPPHVTRDDFFGSWVVSPAHESAFFG